MIAKRIALGFGVVVVFPMLIHYGVSTFVSKPKWEDYQVHPTFDPYASPGEKAEREAKRR